MHTLPMQLRNVFMMMLLGSGNSATAIVVGVFSLPQIRSPTIPSHPYLMRIDIRKRRRIVRGGIYPYERKESIDHVMVCAPSVDCPRVEQSNNAEAIKHDIKKADSAHLLLPPLARVACLGCPLPLVRVHLWPSHFGIESIILHTIVGVSGIWFT